MMLTVPALSDNVLVSVMYSPASADLRPALMSRRRHASRLRRTHDDEPATGRSEPLHCLYNDLKPVILVGDRNVIYHYRSR